MYKTLIHIRNFQVEDQNYQAIAFNCLFADDYVAFIWLVVAKDSLDDIWLDIILCKLFGLLFAVSLSNDLPDKT